MTEKDSAFLRARRALLLDHCFFGNLIMHLQPREDTAAQRGVWVDGKQIGYNKESLERMELIEGAGLLAKGVLQCALGHHLRRGNREVNRWQEASDLVVNPEILGSGLKLPAGAKIDKQYQGKSVEQVYAALGAQEQKQKQQPTAGGKDEQKGAGTGAAGPQGAGKQPGKGQAPGTQQGTPQPGSGAGQQNAPQPQTGEVRDLPGAGGTMPGEAEQSQQTQEWKIALNQALQTAKSRGDLPGNLEKLIATALEPRTPWRQELRRFMLAISRDDQSWAKPNRRFIGTGLYLPAIRAERMGTMVIVNDTSGSTSGAQKIFLAEMQAITEDVNPERIIYIQQDTRITSVQELEPGEEIPCAVRGGGGTDFRPVFAWLDEQTIEPACIVFLTDLLGRFPSTEPPFPVVWAVVGSAKDAPFGDVLEIDVTQ